MSDKPKLILIVDGREIPVRDFKFLHQDGGHPWRGRGAVDSLPSPNESVIRERFLSMTDDYKVEHQADWFKRPGTTTAQMREAPKGATFIWPVAFSISYARALAHHLGRYDLNIVGPGITSDPSLMRGFRPGMLIADHACETHLLPHQLHHLTEAIERNGA